MRQAKGEADRFRVTVAGRLSNIDEFGLFKEDEMYEVKGFFEAIARGVPAAGSIEDRAIVWV